MEFLTDGEEFWKCRKHPSQPRYGVCPTCLTNRLLLLCPNCAAVRPCSCSQPADAPSSSSADGIGNLGTVSSLIDGEPAFRRSRSAAFHLLHLRSVNGRAPPLETRSKPSFWSFLKLEKTKKMPDEAKRDTNLTRSRSAGISSCNSHSGKFSGVDVRVKGWSWYFQSPIKAFRQPKTAKVVHQRSPMCRG